MTREKGERIVQVLKNNPAAASYDAKLSTAWIRQRNFQVVSFAALGLKDVLCLPSKTTVSSSSSQGRALASTRTHWGWGSGWPAVQWGWLEHYLIKVIGLGMYDYACGFPTRPIGLVQYMKHWGCCSASYVSYCLTQLLRLPTHLLPLLPLPPRRFLLTRLLQLPPRRFLPTRLLQLPPRRFLLTRLLQLLPRRFLLTRLLTHLLQLPTCLVPLPRWFPVLPPCALPLLRWYRNLTLPWHPSQRGHVG